MHKSLTAGLACGLLMTFSAHAENGLHGVVTAGIGVMPEYEGAKDLRGIPFLAGTLKWNSVELEMRGLSARANFMPDSRLSFGPIVGMRLARKHAEGPQGHLADIDNTVEAGGFIGYRFGGNETGKGALKTELAVVHDLSDTYDGLVVTASASYAAIQTGRYFLNIDTQTSYVDSHYARTYFGVSQADAAQSGFAAYSPGAGFKDVGIGLTGGYWFNAKFGVTIRAGANYLLGDIADSPLTIQGSRWQPTTAIALAYRF
jgi:MipA family protein